MDDTQLLTNYTQGWIPAPNESVEAFCKRMQAFRILQTALKENPDHPGHSNQIASFEQFPFPFSPQERAPATLQKEAEEKTAAYYGTALRNIPLFCSSKKLAPWQGGVTWICTLEPEGPPVTFIQLHPRFATQSILWGLYKRDELLIHELAHAGRAAFHEPKFEEILAYSSSHSPWRRYIGPLFESTTEALVMILMLTLLLCLEGLMLLGGNVIPSIHIPSHLLLAFWVLPIAGCILLFLRLWYRQRQFHQAFTHLVQAFQASKDPNQSARALLYCLSDHEIRLLAKDPSHLAKMAQQKEEKDPHPHTRLISLLIQRTLSHHAI